MKVGRFFKKVIELDQISNKSFNFFEKTNGQIFPLNIFRQIFLHVYILKNLKTNFLIQQSVNFLTQINQNFRFCIFSLRFETTFFRP